MNDKWPFDQPPNCAVLCVRQIMHDGSPILLVTHDDDDHGWQFLDGSNGPKVEDAMLVSLSNVVEVDPSILEVATLAPGWRAWRKSANSPWIREKNPDGGTSK